MWTYLMLPHIPRMRYIIEKNDQKGSNNTVSNTCAGNQTGDTILIPLFFYKTSITGIIFTSLPLPINKLGSGPNFANSKEAARGQKPAGERRRPASQEGLWTSTRPGSRRMGKGLCAAVPGLQGRGRESAARAFQHGRKPSGMARTHFPSSRTWAPKPTSRTWETPHLVQDGVLPPSREQASMF